MELFEIRIFRKPREVFSVIYSVDPAGSASHFVSVNDFRKILLHPGNNPEWMIKAMEIQKNNLPLAREYVFQKIKMALQLPEFSAKLVFTWTESTFRHDEFMERVRMLLMPEEDEVA